MFEIDKNNNHLIVTVYFWCLMFLKITSHYSSNIHFDGGGGYVRLIHAQPKQGYIFMSFAMSRPESQCRLQSGFVLV
jgi:Ni,Fe-hydrogenase I cytochrome b subunit